MPCKFRNVRISLNWHHLHLSATRRKPRIFRILVSQLSVRYLLLKYMYNNFSVLNTCLIDISYIYKHVKTLLFHKQGAREKDLRYREDAAFLFNFTDVIVTQAKSP